MGGAVCVYRDRNIDRSVAAKKESGEGERGERDMHGLKWCVSTAALLTTLALLHQVMRKHCV